MKKSHYVFFPNKIFPDHMNILPQSGGAEDCSPLNNSCPYLHPGHGQHLGLLNLGMNALKDFPLGKTSLGIFSLGI